MKKIANILDITSLTPDYIGCIFYHSSRRFVGNNFIVPKLKRCKKVGVFVNATENYVVSKSLINQLDFVQLHGNESPNYCYNIINQGIKIIKAFGIHEAFQFDQIKSFQNICHYVLFDYDTRTYGGSGKKFNWNKIQEYNIEIPFFISGGISIDDIKDILAITHPLLFGIDINSQFESEPGIKDFNKVKKFIQKIRL